MKPSCNIFCTYGINGSLRKKETTQPQQHIEYYLFNSQGNLKAYSDDIMDFAYYGYNAANTRTYKLSLYNTNMWINGQQQPLNLQWQNAMFYPNTYLNFNQNGEYTKHYYNGTERIASRLGDNNTTIAIDNMLENRKLSLEERVRNEIQELISEPTQVDMPPMLDILNLQPTGTPNDIYYYHPNHLGSTSFVTDQNQTITQGFLYAPFGEITTEYNINFGNNTIPKYSFNAKELDEETGFYYYEARYYAPPTFTSRDPLFEKYFWMSPYAYCANNPVNAIDPDGRSSYRIDEDGNIILVKQNNKDYDRIYATNSKGKIDKSNYIQVGKEILSTKNTIKDVKYINSVGETFTTDIDIYTTPNIESATNFFQFVAKNSNVEWSYVHGCENGTTDINYIGTGHREGEDPSQDYITSKYMGENVTVERADHNHPNNSSIVSQGDVSIATKIQKKFPNAIFNIYLPKFNKYKSYDQNSTPGLFEEIRVKPKD